MTPDRPFLASEIDLFALLCHRCQIVDHWDQALDRYTMLSTGERTVVRLLARMHPGVTAADLIMLDDDYRQACERVIHERAARGQV